MSHSWQGDKALRIDPKRTECEANEGGGGPSQYTLPPAGTAALASTRTTSVSRLTIGPRPTPLRPVRRRRHAERSNR